MSIFITYCRRESILGHIDACASLNQGGASFQTYYLLHLFRKQCRINLVSFDRLCNGVSVFVEQDVNVYSIIYGSRQPG